MRRETKGRMMTYLQADELCVIIDDLMDCLLSEKFNTRIANLQDDIRKLRSELKETE